MESSKNKRKRRSRRGSRNSSQNSSRRNSFSDEVSQQDSINRGTDGQSWRQNGSPQSNCDNKQNVTSWRQACRAQTPQKQTQNLTRQSNDREITVKDDLFSKTENNECVQSQTHEKSNANRSSTESLAVDKNVNLPQVSSEISQNQMDCDSNVNRTLQPLDLNQTFLLNSNVNVSLSHTPLNVHAAPWKESDLQQKDLTASANLQSITSSEQSKIMYEMPQAHQNISDSVKSSDVDSEWKKLPENKHKYARRKISDTVSPSVDSVTSVRQSPPKVDSRRKSSDTSLPIVEDSKNSERQIPKRKVSDSSKPPLNIQNPRRKNSSEERKLKNDSGKSELVLVTKFQKNETPPPELREESIISEQDTVLNSGSQKVEQFRKEVNLLSSKSPKTSSLEKSNGGGLASGSVTEEICDNQTVSVKIDSDETIIKTRLNSTEVMANNIDYTLLMSKCADPVNFISMENFEHENKEDNNKSTDLNRISQKLNNSDLPLLEVNLDGVQLASSKDKNLKDLFEHSKQKKSLGQCISFQNKEVMPVEMSLPFGRDTVDQLAMSHDPFDDPTEEILTLKRKIRELQKELNRKIEENEEGETANGMSKDSLLMTNVAIGDLSKELALTHLVNESDTISNEDDLPKISAINSKDNYKSNQEMSIVSSDKGAVKHQTLVVTSKQPPSNKNDSSVKSLSRSKQKGKHKQREMNQKGVEKEGTDMDAFIDTNTRPSDNNNRVINDLSSRVPPTDTKTNDLGSRTNNDNSVSRTSSDIRNTDRPTDRSMSNDNSLSNDSKHLTDNSKTDTREKSPAQAQADATNNNINNQIAQQMEESEDSSVDMVEAKNHENNKKNNMDDDSLMDGDSHIIGSSSQQPSLKYQYKDDQWSPVNPQGKKVYDRDFLMKLREDPQSSKKPDITTDLEIFVKEGQIGSIGGSGGSGIRRNASSHGPYSSFSSNPSMRTSSNNGLFPDFIRTSISQRMPPKRNSQGGGGNRGPGGGQRSLKMYGMNLRDEYKLSLSENAWKPSKLNRAQEIKTKEERESEDLYKKVRGILNKLTPQKFDTLVLQFQNLPINSIERLQGTIKLVFEKAVDEPAFSLSYANLCKVLARLQVSEAQGTTPAAATQPQDPNAAKVQPVLFRKLLITRCQQEFETNKKLELDFEKRQKDINETPDLEKRKELQLLFNEEERKIRMKSVGLVTFIGELFKLKMLTVNIMHGCIKQLLGKIDEESLECLCKLLTTIGKEFEEQIANKSGPGGISEFNDYFLQMAKLSKKHDSSRVSSRVRFMLQDVIELRQNSWVPRRDENKPKTLAQIHEEVERESEKAAMLAAQSLRAPQNMNQDRGGSNRRNNARSVNQSEDGWTSVGSSKYSRNTNYAAEVSKIQGLRTTATQELDRGARGESVTLGPSAGYSKWGLGAGSSTRAQSSTAGFTDTNSFSPLLDNADRKQPQPGSRFSSLKMSNDSKEADKKEALLQTAAFLRQPSGGDSSRDRDNSRGRSAGGSSPSPSLSGPTMRKHPSLIEQPSSRPTEMQRRTQSDTGRAGSTESSRESTPGLMVPVIDKSRVEPPPSPAQPVDEDKLKQSATTIIEEYISNVNIQESVECYKEQFVDSGTIFVSTCLNFIVDQMKREKRQKTSQLLGELMKHELFLPSLLVSELQVFFEMIYDLAVDIPHIWQYLGELFGDIMCIGVMDFSHLKEASRPIPQSSSDTNKLDGTLREVFKILLREMVPISVKKLWDSSSVQINDFISDKAVADKFLTDYAFLEGKEVIASDSKLPYKEVEEKLLMFLKSNENFDQICGWLTVQVGKRTDDPTFIRHLTEAVIKSSVSFDSETKSYTFDKNILNKNLKFIKRYVDNNEELELSCLYSVQYVVVIDLESPYGMLVEIFRELYEGMVISPEGFNKWRQDEKRCQGWQKEGRGVAIASSKSFFQAMEQEINDEQDDEPS